MVDTKTALTVDGHTPSLFILESRHFFYNDAGDILIGVISEIIKKTLPLGIVKRHEFRVTYSEPWDIVIEFPDMFYDHGSYESAVKALFIAYEALKTEQDT